MQDLRQACERGTFKKLELDTEYPAGPITVGVERKIWILHTLYHQKIQFPKPGKYSITNLYLHVSAIFMWTSWILKHFYTILNNFFLETILLKTRKITCLLTVNEYLHQFPWVDCANVELSQKKKEFQYQNVFYIKTLAVSSLVWPRQHV